ncbi:MAG: NUDIX hydrolase [candidate division WOR-3 bacterium]
MKNLTKRRKREKRSPEPTVDIIIRYRQGIILIKRKNPPYGWAIPGGFIDYGESAEAAARREAREETNLTLISLKQFHVYSRPDRDPRGHRISIVFTAVGKGKLKAKTDARQAKVFTAKSLPKIIAFDHRQILKDYFNKKYQY